MRTRVALGAIGILLISFGALRILTNSGSTHPLQLALWLVGGTVLHDGALVPITMLLGLAVSVAVRPRARRYVQGALVVGALVTATAIPLIYRRGSQPAGKALERQNYGLHLAVLLGLITAAAAIAYVIRLVRDQRAAAGSDVHASAESTSDEP